MKAKPGIGRRRWIGAALATAGLGLLPAGRRAAAADGFQAVPKHLQVLRTAPASWPQVVELSRRMGIGAVALSIPPEDRKRFLADNPAGIAAFEPFRRAGLDVRCMIGDAEWARDRPDALPLELIELLHVHERVFRFKGLLLDVQPQTLPDWKTERAALVRGTLSLYATAHAACKVRQLSFAAALAPWYVATPDPDRRGASFFDSSLRRMDEALVMAYRNDPDKAIALAQGALAALERRPIPYWFGVSTQPGNAPGSSYHGLGLARFQHDLVALRERLEDSPGRPQFAGIAIHQFATLRALANA